MFFFASRWLVLLVICLKTLELALEKLLFDYLDHEIHISTSCSLSASEWSLNIFTLSGKASEASISCSGYRPLTVKTIEGKFNLSAVLSGKIILDLRLVDVTAESFLPGSELYKFISYLSEDSPEPPKIRIFLRKMTVVDFNAKDIFQQQPATVVVKELAYFREDSSLLHLSMDVSSGIWNSFNASEVTAHLKVTDNSAEVVKFRAKLGDKAVNFEGLIFPFVKIKGHLSNAKQLGLFDVDAEGNLIKLKSDLGFHGLKISSYELDNLTLLLDAVFDRSLVGLTNLSLISDLIKECAVDLRAERVVLSNDLKLKDLIVEIKKTPNSAIAAKISFEFKGLAVNFAGVLDRSVLTLKFNAPFVSTVRVDLEELEFNAKDLVYQNLLISNFFGKISGKTFEGAFQALGKQFNFALDKKGYKFKSIDGQIKGDVGLTSAEFEFDRAQIYIQDKDFFVTGKFIWENGFWNGSIEEGRLTLAVLNQPLSIEFSGLAIKRNQLHLKKNQTTILGSFELSAEGSLDNFSVSLTGNLQLEEVLKKHFPEILMFLPAQVEAEFWFQKFSLVNFSSRALIEQGFAFDYVNHIFLENIKAKANWGSQNYLDFKLQGLFNGGSFEILGEGNPFELEAMKVSGSFNNASFNRPQLFNLNISGDFTFDKVLNLNLKLKDGWVKLPNPSLLKRLIDRSTENFKPVFKDLLRKIEGKALLQTLSQIQISTPNIKTSFAGQLEIFNQAGVLNFSGGFQSLGGFIKLGANYFEIISGFVEVGDNQLLTINLEAKKTFFYAPRYPVSITAELEGSVFEPRISFLSNPYLSEQEIQRLIFLKDPNPTIVDVEGLKLIDREDIFDPIIPQALGNFLLPEDVSFDVKSVEEGQSTYSFYLGKQIFPNLYLIGESAFEVDRVKRRFKMKFVPLPFVEFIGSLIDDPLLKRLEVAGDVVFKWRHSQNNLFVLSGDNKEAIEALKHRLPKVSFARKSSFPALVEWTKHQLKEVGFQNCKVNIVCKIDYADYCLKADILIESGKKYVLNKILTQPDSNQLGVKKVNEFLGKPFTDDLIKELKHSIKFELLENGKYYRSLKQEVRCEELESLVSCQLFLDFDDLITVKFDREAFQQDDHLFEFKKVLVRDLNYLTDKTDKLDLTRYASALNELFFRTFNVNYNFEIKKYNSSVFINVEKLPFKIKVREETSSQEKCSALENLEGASLKEMIDLANSEAQKCNKVIRKFSISRAEPTLYLLTVHSSSTQRGEGFFIMVDEKLAELDLPDFIEGDEVSVLQAVQSALLQKGYGKWRLEVFASEGKKYLLVKDLEFQIIKEVHLLAGSKIPVSLIQKLDEFKGRAASRDTFKLIKSILINEGFGRISAFDLDPKTGVLSILCDAVYSDELQIGGGFSSELGWHSLLIFSNQSWFSKGRTLMSKVDVYMKEDFSALNSGSTVLSFLYPSTKGRGFSWDYSALFRRSVVSALPFEYEHAKVSVTANLQREVNLNLSAGVDYYDLFNVASDFVFKKSDFVAPFLAVKMVDMSDLNMDIKTQGWKWELESRLSFPNQSFFELKGMVGYRIDVAKDLYFHQSFNAGFIRPLLDDYVEGPNRYFLGGRDSVRGYNLNGLGETGEVGSPIGGETFFYSKSELIYEFMEDLGAVVFGDAGALDKFARDHAGIGLGLGLRYLTPIGPLGLDYAKALLENAASKENAFYFTIGFVF